VKNKWLNSEKFWQTFCFLEEQREPINVPEMMMDLEVDEQTIHQALYLFHNLGVEFDYQTIHTAEGSVKNKVIIPPKNKPTIKLDLGLSEWIALQAHFPFFKDLDHQSFHQTLVEKLAKVEGENKQHDLFSVTPSASTCSLEEHVNEEMEELFHMATKIEEAILEKAVLTLRLKPNSCKDVYPFRLVYIEDSLTLIAEDTVDRCLVAISLHDVLFVKDDWQKSYEGHFTNLEVNDFISGLRSVSDEEVRLILKFKGMDNFEFPYPYHFFGNPYVVTNGEGDQIWAASVEPTPIIYDWLLELGESVEVLDPSSFKKNLEAYQQNKVNSLKKAG
jgi:predicted DNA-binding transcriptional regulator YafY